MTLPANNGDQMFCGRCGWPVGEAEVQFVPDVASGLVMAGHAPTPLNVVCRNAGAGLLEIVLSFPNGVSPDPDAHGSRLKTENDMSVLVPSGTEKIIRLLVNPDSIADGADALDLIIKTRDKQGSFPRNYRGGIVDTSFQVYENRFPIVRQRIGLHIRKPILVYRLDRPRLQLLPLENTGGSDLPINVVGQNGVLIGVLGQNQRRTNCEVTVRANTTEILEVELTDEAAHRLNSGDRRDLPSLSVQSAKLPSSFQGDILIRVVPPVPSTRPVHPWIIGIDFGTAKTAASLVRNRPGQAIKPIIAQWPWENNTKESKVDSVLVYRNTGGRPLFGVKAINPERDAVVVRSMKKYLASEIDIPMPNGSKRPVLDVVTDFLRAVHGELRSQEELVQTGNRAIDEALIALSIPVHLDERLDELQRENTEKAARAAGFAKNDLEFYYEPECAAVDYLLRQRDYDLDLNLGDIIAVFDLGAGTTDICILKVSRENDNPTFTRLAQVGFPLGGDLIDELLADKALKHWTEVAHSINIPVTSGSAKSKGKTADPDKLEYPITIKGHTEERKDALKVLRQGYKEKLGSGEEEKKGYEPFLDDNFAFSVTWDLLATLFTPYLTMMLTDGVSAGAEIRDSNIEGGKLTVSSRIPSVDDQLFNIGKDSRDIAYVLLTGGSSFMPFIASTLQEYFSAAKIIPDEDKRSAMLKDPTQPHTLNVARGAAARVCYRFDSPLPFDLNIRLRSADDQTELTKKAGLAKNAVKGTLSDTHQFPLTQNYKGYLEVILLSPSEEPLVIFQKQVMNSHFERKYIDAQLHHDAEGKIWLSIKSDDEDGEPFEVLQ